MSNIWFIFNNEGEFLFKTTNEKNISLIPASFNATYIIENPTGYDPELEQVASYDIATEKVVFEDALTLDAIGSSEVNPEAEIVDYKQMEEDIKSLKTIVAALEARLHTTEQILNATFPQ